MKEKTLRFLLLVLLVVLVAACGPAGSPEELATEDARPTNTRPAIVEEEPATPVSVATETSGEEGSGEEEPAEPSQPAVEIDDSEFATTESGLRYAIYEEGSGAEAEAGDIVRVHYTGRLEDGTEFDTSLDTGQPIQFALGTGRVIPGWDEGIALLREGDKARFIIPSDLAYGPQGSGGVIPPDATLIFDVELVEILPGSPDSPTAVDEADLVTSESGLQYYDIEEGTGETPQPGQLVTVQYTLWLEDGTKIDSSLDSGQALVYEVGAGQLFPGLEEGIATMQVGGRRQLIIPPDLAFGPAGSGPIPPDATIIFEVELESVQ
jgi:peptidylprolyl isomerase